MELEGAKVGAEDGVDWSSWRLTRDGLRRVKDGATRP